MKYKCFHFTPHRLTPARLLTSDLCPQPIVIPASLSAADLERLERVERQLALLWERVQQGDQKQDVRHGDILGLYNTLKEQLHTETDKERLGLWVSALLDQRLAPLRGELEQESALREKVKKWIKNSFTSRLIILCMNYDCISENAE